MLTSDLTTSAGLINSQNDLLNGKRPEIQLHSKSGLMLINTNLQPLMKAVIPVFMRTNGLVRSIVLSDKKPSRALFWWRELGESRFSKTLLKSVGRGVYTVELPAAAAMHDFEYCVQITPEEGDPVLFPPTAPDLNQTVVVWNMAR